jgi:glycerol-3-phosphate dehydrogenase
MVSDSGLITITGGKWTTYRKMAEETVNMAIKVGGLSPVACRTRQLPIHGSSALTMDNPMAIYGTDQKGIQALILEDPSLDKLLAEGLPYLQAEVVWAVRHEMARTVEDVLARRLRMLFLNARAAIAAAPRVAELIAGELGRNENWVAEQLKTFNAVANNYLLEPVHEEIATTH